MGAIISRPGDGERFVRENRTVTIRLDLPELSIHEIEFDATFAVCDLVVGPYRRRSSVSTTE